MPSLISNNYLARQPIEKALKKFAESCHKDEKILDIGCGQKPYKNYFKASYFGIDHDTNSKADIVCDSTEIPLPSESFDKIIATQVFEHTADVPGTLREIHRLLKPGGTCFISVPMTVRVHGIPEQKYGYDNWYVDYWRFTKYGLILVCKDFSIVSIQETSGYVGTMMQLINYFISSFGLSYIFIPIYFFTNMTGIIADGFARFLFSFNVPIISRAYTLIYMSMPLNYCLIIKK